MSREPFVIIGTKKHACAAYRCRAKRDGRGRLCAKHYKRLRRWKDPVAYAYSVTKCNARRRGKDFDISLEDWRTFCAATGYVEAKGRKASAASIDRIDNSRGYTLDNIRVISLSDNSRKGCAEEVPF